MRAQRTATAAALALAATGAMRSQAVESRQPAAGAAQADTVARTATTLAEQSSGTAPEPTLWEVEEAAMRTAAGTAEEDNSRSWRARAAHWAPALRGQFGIRDDLRSRRGEFRLAPLSEDDTGQSTAWAVVASWDVAQIVYSRDETQLALTHVHLARVRQQAAAEAAQLYEERWRRRIFLRLHGGGPSQERNDSVLGLLRATAGLDALTGGLFQAQLAEAEEQLSALGSQLTSDVSFRSLPPAAALSVPPPLPALGLFSARGSAVATPPADPVRRAALSSTPYTSTAVEEEDQ